jgi:hypothetical protein
MTFHFDVVISTMIVSAVVALVGWFLKGGISLLVDAIKALIAKLTETIARVEVLDSKLGVVTEAIGDVQKIRYDVNGLYRRLEVAEEKINNMH